MLSFSEKLQNAWQQQDSMLVIGLDPDLNRLPLTFRNQKKPIFDFCKGIIDATAEYACAFKPQIAYFASQEAETELQRLCHYIRDEYPHLPIILDSKRGDIGTTAEHYAKEAFERYCADAVTVNPYMGFDSVEPYLCWHNKGVIVLCRTSNPGSSEFQTIETADGQPLYLKVAQTVAEKWNQNQQCALVVGATYPEDLAQVRQCVGDDVPFLIPGIGAQGGDIELTVKAGCNRQGNGIMLNSSRAILYADAGEQWQAAAARVAQQTRDSIKQALAKR
ncbi:orotidine-5'-phosphate decarboxylase [Brackiella oedipodis]|uniref:orotidine-5'-phosphate decarboxylase n=1 Tax=Brackiella oedipodis TaxID=124225 RepID=UPI00048C803B|nr:orotidine-5'-phosphate decarboxylase [Brackiella oedipodis]